MRSKEKRRGREEMGTERGTQRERGKEVRKGRQGRRKRKIFVSLDRLNLRSKVFEKQAQDLRFL
jgi:hypothetical protein